jgi:phospholipid/cholesterol/gamma-HCH transport system substrate-binding protein
MIKQSPSAGRIAAMVLFTFSCVGILLFLWLSFGGAVPLKPQSYRFKAKIPEAPTLAEEADVRMAGVNVGKVKKKELDKGSARTVVEMEINPDFAPIAKDSKVILRQKTLLGESYIEVSPGHRKLHGKPNTLDDGAELPVAQVENTVELDEIFSAFDKDTRAAFKSWIKELADAIKGGRSADLSSAFGNLEPFATDGSDLLKVLDEQQISVRRLVRNTGQVFGAINEREGALGELIKNSNDVFSATASRDRALAETFQVFPTFLDESKATLARLERFTKNAHPLVNQLKGPARDLGPTVRDLGDLAPDLTRLFRDLPPLVRSSRKGLPALSRVLTGASPVFDEIRPFLAELNPILSYANFHQDTISSFLTIGGVDFGCSQRGHGNCNPDAGSQRYQVNFAVIEPRSFDRFTKTPDYERGNSYMAPNALLRAGNLGVIESFHCPGGEQPNPVDTQTPPFVGPPTKPPCFQQPGSLYDGKQFPVPQRGRAPKVDKPGPTAGTRPANDPAPSDPLR